MSAYRLPAHPVAGDASKVEISFHVVISGLLLGFTSCLLQRVQSLGVQGLIPAETSANGGGVLNRKITERLMSLKDLAARQVERADRMERARRATQVSGACAALRGRCRLQVLHCSPFLYPRPPLVASSCEWRRDDVGEEVEIFREDRGDKTVLLNSACLFRWYLAVI